MMWKMIHKELKEIFRLGVFQLGALAILILMIGALVMSYRYQEVLTEQIETANENARSRWENQGKKNQHVAAHFGIYLFKPLSDLAMWDHGVEKFTGVTVYTEAHKRNPALFKAAQDSPALALWGELTPAFVMVVLLPLLAIWISSGQVSQEKVQGTYQLVISQGASPISWMSAKALAVWMVIIGLAVPTFFMGITLANWGSSFSLLSPRIGLLMGVYLTYLGIFIHLSLALSTRFRKVSPVLATMVGFWIVTLWVVPKIGSSVAEKLYPVPDGEAFHEAMLTDIEVEGIPSHAPPSPRKKAFIQELLDRYEVDKVEALPVNFNGLRLQASEEANAPIMDRHFQELYAQYEKQERVHEMTGILSPYSLVKRLSMGLCQTDVWNQVAFADSVESYRLEYITMLNEDISEKGGPGISWALQADKETWSSIPKFEYKLPGLSVFWQHYGLGMTILGAWFVFSFMVWRMSIHRF